MTRIHRLLVAAALALGVGCGDSDGGGGSAAGSGGSGGGAEPVAEMITATEGGEVATGGAALDIPAGALGEDTEITVEAVDKDGLAGEGNIASEVYDFGPDGTTFEMPVTLTIDFDASATPEGMKAVIAYLDGDTWEPLADSEISGDSVVATTTHFTLFAVVWTPDGAMQTEGSCEGTTFEACGGELTGTWDISLGCVTLPAEVLGSITNEEPFASCDGAAVSAEADVTGSITFGADGSYSSETTFATTITITLPKTCLPQGATCQDLSTDMSATDTGDNCEQTMMSSDPQTDMGTYEADDVAGTLTMTTTGSTEPDPTSEYCVTGNTLVVRLPGDDKNPEVFLTATKQ